MIGTWFKRLNCRGSCLLTVIDGVAPADLTHILSIAEDDIIEPEGTAEDAVRIEHKFIASLEKALD